MLPIVKLIRRTPYPDECVLGVMRDADGQLLCRTLELPWRDNETDRSCVPPGGYQARLYHSPTKGPVFRLDFEDTKPRSAIEVHAANTAHDLLGCIAPGARHGILDGRPAVLDSRVTLDMLLRRYHDGFHLAIEDATDR